MFFTFFIATYVSILTSDTSSNPHGVTFAGLQNAPLPLAPLGSKSTSSVLYLSPVTLSAQDHLTSELLRFL